METKGKILVVEDYQNWREQLQRLLEKDGFTVKTAANIGEVQDILRMQMFDFAVVDIRLSEGLSDTEHDAAQMEQTLREIQQYGDDTRILVLSAYGTPRLVRNAFKKFGVADFMEKADFNRDQFLHIVRMWTQNAVEKRSANPLRFDPSLVGHARLESLTKGLALRMDAALAVREIERFLDVLLKEMLPLSPEGIKLDIISAIPRLASFWCWSRMHGKAVVIELKDYEEAKELLRSQLTSKWHVAVSKTGYWSAIDLSGVVYTLTDMSFPEFIAEIGEISV
jgi:ActR/RegA family two-component response regulator